MNVKQVICALLSAILMGCFAKPSEKTGLEGKPLPSFKLLLLDSTTYFNTINLPREKPVVLFYFGPNCPYSHAQMKEIIANMETLRNINFCILTSESFSDMKRFCAVYKLSQYSNIIVGLDNLYFFADYFKAPGVPYIAVYGKSKKLNAAFLGKVTGKQIKINAEK